MTAAVTRQAHAYHIGMCMQPRREALSIFLDFWVPIPGHERGILFMLIAEGLQHQASSLVNTIRIAVIDVSENAVERDSISRTTAMLSDAGQQTILLRESITTKQSTP